MLLEQQQEIRRLAWPGGDALHPALRYLHGSMDTVYLTGYMSRPGYMWENAQLRLVNTTPTHNASA